MSDRSGSAGFAPAVCVEQKHTQKAALEFRGDLTQIRLFARSGRQFDRQIIADEVVETPERLDCQEVEGQLHCPRQLELPPKRLECHSAGS
jgi:hypothetical protein